MYKVNRTNILTLASEHLLVAKQIEAEAGDLLPEHLADN